MAKSLLGVVLCGVAIGQRPSCDYKGGPNEAYTLNLTSIAGWRMEFQSPTDTLAYYYTPCINDLVCHQGNAQYTANSVQYKVGANTCEHWLSVDRHELPTYFLGGAAWAFHYQDGQTCSSTGLPRELDVFMLCDENMDAGARIYDVIEPDTCNYAMSIRSPLACVPEDRRNANCQWKVSQNGTTFYLDLSKAKGATYHGRESRNGYIMYYSPCQNALPCYQQTGKIKMMSIVENDVTRTCDHYLAEWQEGRVQPILHYTNRNEAHWSFHYYLSQKCPNGMLGEETIRWYCDKTAREPVVLNATYDGYCRWELNMASELACPTNRIYTEHRGVKVEDLMKGTNKN